MKKGLLLQAVCTGCLTLLLIPSGLRAQPKATFPPIAVVNDGEPAFATLAITGTGFGTRISSSFIALDGPPYIVRSDCDCAIPNPGIPNCTATQCIDEWQPSLITARVSSPAASPVRVAVITSAGGSDAYPADYYMYDWYDALQQLGPAPGHCGPIAIGRDSHGGVWLNCEGHTDFKHLNPAIGRAASIPLGHPPDNKGIFATPLGSTPVNFAAGEDVFVDPYDRVWISEKGTWGTGVPLENPNHARIVMYDQVPRTSLVYSVPGNHNHTFGVLFQSGITCSAGICQDETVPLGGRSCTQNRDCDRVWFTEQLRSQFHLPAAPPARLTWFDPRITPPSDGTYDFPVDPPTQGCHNRHCPSSAQICTQDSDCAPAPCGSGVCEDWPGRACFVDQDCARGSAGVDGATACRWNEWTPASDCYYHEYELPITVDTPAFAVIGDDGGLWFTSYYVDNSIGRVNLGTGQVQMFPLPPMQVPPQSFIFYNPWDIKQAPRQPGEQFGDIVMSEFFNFALTRFDVDRLYPPNNPADCLQLSGNPLQNPCMTETLIPGWTESKRVGAIAFDASGKLWFAGTPSVGYLKAGSNQAVLFPPITTLFNNRARGAIATQAPSYFPPRDATFAVDGNTDGNWDNRSCMLTASQPQPWWQVDMTYPRSVSQVRIWNVNGGTTLQNFYVIGLDQKPATDDLATWRAMEKWEVYQPGQVGASITLNVAEDQPGVPKTARYVRLQRADTGNLQMCEVQVLGPSDATSVASVEVDPATNDVWVAVGRAVGGQFGRRVAAFGRYVPLRRNLAIGRTATQAPSDPQYGADRAVDGDPDADFSHGSATLTGNQYQPWWQVDLGSINSLQLVDVWKVNGPNGDSLANFYVLVSDVPFASNSLSALLADPNVSSYYFPAPAERLKSVNVNRTGRYVRVQLTTTAALSLAEVTVEGNAVSACTPATQLTACDDGNACTSDICHRGRCYHECRIGNSLLVGGNPPVFCPDGGTCQNDKGVCECRTQPFPF